MKLKLLLLIEAVEFLCCMTNSVKLNNGIKNEEPQNIFMSYFPDVTYPTSIFEINEPFYYKSHTLGDGLRVFSDDVKNSFKFNGKSNSNKKCTAINKSDIERIVKDLSKVIVNVTKNIEPEIDKNSKEQNYTATEKYIICPIDEDSNKIENSDSDKSEMNVTIIIEEDGVEDIYTNDTIEKGRDNQDNSYKIPLRIKVDIEVRRGVLKANSDLLESIVNQTLYTFLEDFGSANNLSNIEEPIMKRLDEINLNLEEKLTQLDEFNETDFLNVFSTLLPNYFNIVGNDTSEDLTSQPDFEETTQTVSCELHTFTPFTENTVCFIDNGLENNSEENWLHKNISYPDGTEDFIRDHKNHNKQNEIYSEEKESVEGNDYFLELVISLNNFLQNNDFQITNDTSDFAKKYLINYNDNIPETR